MHRNAVVPPRFPTRADYPYQMMFGWWPEGHEGTNLVLRPIEVHRDARGWSKTEEDIMMMHKRQTPYESR
jgi:hypothetical protein